MAGESYSIVEYFSGQNKSRCGYCKSPNTNFSHGLWAHTLTVRDYQDLIDRGWRRSGNYCYKPTMDRTCCPMYTIKCEALQFKISKSQKKVLKRVSKFLRNELKRDDVMDTNEDHHNNLDFNIREVPNYNKHLVRAEKNATEINVSSINIEINERLQSTTSNSSIESSEPKGERKHEATISSVENQGDSVVDIGKATPHANKAFCKKAKLLRLERKQNKLLAQGKTQKEIDTMLKENHKQNNNMKSLEDLFDEVNNGIMKLEIKLLRVMSEEFLSKLDASANLYKKYQMAIHGDPPEECNKKSFFNFLVKSPLQPWTPEDGPPDGYGSFHEQYWLNDELIAVGVIDILPSCVSSVYFFYDPAYSFLSLGTFSSLREVYLTRQLNKTVPNLKYYYMGFYIHTCPKMRYKARMQPSKLLCPETYTWCDIEPCLQKLDKEKYSRLSEDLDAIDGNGIVDINKVLILYRGIATPYRIYKTRFHRAITNPDENEIKQYATLVGMKCAQSLLLYRN